MLLDHWINSRTKGNSQEAARWISATKAVSWRIVGTIDTWIISFLITGEWKLAFSIASVEVFSKVLLYYLHERAWEKVRVRVSQKTV
ncbi:MAG: DUF2061 domain-containing protein [Cyclobacteriaceae bacterium]|nr:DUF2061 domain-containing protein [Cyclobacteriaceae bacterium]NBP71235.1 DUF2061 domain-containing protein [Cytophagia bacterium]NBW34232.1 DUF2061 domain-containing protein [Cytophagia bacterium]